MEKVGQYMGFDIFIESDEDGAYWWGGWERHPHSRPRRRMAEVRAWVEGLFSEGGERPD